jgi:hypothetical protein
LLFFGQMLHELGAPALRGALLQQLPDENRGYQRNAEDEQNQTQSIHGVSPKLL